MREALVDRIFQTQRHQVDLVEKLKALKALEAMKLSTLPLESSFDRDPKPNREMFKMLSLPVSSEDETRIQHIREDPLTPYPPMPDPSAPRLSSLKTVQTESARATSSRVVPLSIKRKSMRFSMAQKSRPSLFQIVGMQDVVNQVK